MPPCCMNSFQDIFQISELGKRFLISEFRHVLNVLCFFLGNSPASEFYMHKYNYIKFRCRGITQKKAYTFKIWRKFKIKNNSPLWGGNCKTLSTIRKNLNQHIKFRRQGITQMKAYNTEKRYF